MQRQKNVYFRLFVLLFLTSFTFILNTSPPIEPRRWDTYQIKGAIIHSKISINGNTALDAFCSGNGTNGTVLNPYMIKNFEINGGNSGNGILITNTNRYLIIQNCTIWNAGSSTANGAIKLINATHVKIINNSITNSRVGLNIDSSNDTLIKNNSITGSSSYAIYFLSSNWGNITGNIIRGTQTNYAVYIWSSHYLRFSFNRIFNNLLLAVYISLSNHGHYTGNLVTNNSQRGMYISGAINNTLSANNISNNALTNLYLTGNANNNSLLGNIIQSVIPKGIIIDGSNTIVMKDNNIINDGLYVASSTGNTITTTNMVNGKPLKYFQSISNLKAENFTNAGQIVLISVQYSEIKNIAIHNTYYGVYSSGAAHNIIKNCTFSDNTNGIYQNLGYNNTIINCSFYNNREYAIGLYSSNGNKIINNTIHNTPIYLQTSSNNQIYGNKMFETGIYDDITTSATPYYNIISSNNTVNSRPVRYYQNIGGLHLDGSSGVGQYILMNVVDSTIENAFINTGYIGILAALCQNITFRNITSVNQLFYGFRGDRPTNLKIRYCNFSQNGQTGVDLRNPSGNNISSCQISCNGLSGVYFGRGSVGTTNIVQNCTINSNARYGIHDYNSVDDDFTNNTIKFNRINGIYLNGADTGDVSFNVIADNYNYGMNIDNTAGSNKCWKNIFNNNTNGQAISTSGTTVWDNGTHGNYWYDYNIRYPTATHNGIYWNIAYTITGSGNNKDNFPLVVNHIPRINSPPDQIIDYGTTGNIIEWTITDIIVGNTSYYVLRNNMPYLGGNWTSGTPFLIPINGLTVGLHNFTIQGSDGLGFNVTDEVWIEVKFTNFAPQFVTIPANLTYELATTGHQLSWIVTDATISNPRYTLFRNQIAILTDITWASEIPINYSLDGLPLGLYNFTLIVTDGLGGQNRSEIWVEVKSDSNTTTTDTEPSSSTNTNTDSTNGQGPSRIIGYPTIFVVCLIITTGFCLIKSKRRFF